VATIVATLAAGAAPGRVERVVWPLDLDRAVRFALVGLNLFLGVHALFGAVAVVPALPPPWLAGTPFPDYTIPALALGAVGAGALLAAAALLPREEWGVRLALAAGAGVAAFEVVETLVVGLDVWLHALALAPRLRARRPGGPVRKSDRSPASSAPTVSRTAVDGPIARSERLRLLLAHLVDQRLEVDGVHGAPAGVQRVEDLEAEQPPGPIDRRVAPEHGDELPELALDGAVRHGRVGGAVQEAHPLQVERQPVEPVGAGPPEGLLDLGSVLRRAGRTVSGRSPAGRVGRRRRSRGSCGATPRPAAATCSTGPPRPHGTRTAGRTSPR
jgi:hypothetical protein